MYFITCLQIVLRINQTIIHVTDSEQNELVLNGLLSAKTKINNLWYNNCTVTTLPCTSLHVYKLF